MTMKRNDMQRMIIEGVRRLLCGVQPAQEAMGAGSIDHLTGVNRSLEPAQTAFSSGTDGHSSGKKRPFFRQRTAVLSAKNARSLGKEQQFPREEIFVPSGGNNIFLGRKSFFPRFALRTLLVIAMILGGVLESGAQTEVSDELGLRNAIDKGGTQTIKLKTDISLSSTLTINSDVNITLDLNGKTLKNGTYTSWGGSTKYYDVKQIIVVSKGQLTITDYSINKNGSLYIYYPSSFFDTDKIELIGVSISDEGMLTLQNGGIISECARWAATGIKISDRGSFCMLGGKVKASAVVNVANEYNGTALKKEGGTVSLKGGELIGEAKGSGKGVAIISDQSFSSICSQGYGIYQNNQLQAASSSSVEGTVTIEPIKYKFNYHTNGGSVQDYTSTECYTIENKNISFLPTDIGTKVGYQFTGEWYYESNLTTKVTASNLPFPTTDVVDIYAKWTPASYTIQFNAQGGSPIADESYTIETSVTLKNGSNYVDRYVPVYAYRTFQGWYTAGSDAEVTTVGPGRTGDLTLYARWQKKTYTVKYDYNGGAAVAGGNYPETYQVGDDITIGTATHETNRFGGWKDRTLQKVLENNKLPSSEPSDLDLVVIWDVPYTITFETGFYDVVAPSPITTFVSEPKELPSVSRKGYTFKRWKDAEGNTHEGGKVYNGDADVTLTAEWEIVTYSVTFMAEGIEGYPQKIDFTIESVVTDFPQPNRKGYIFQGWYNGTEKVSSIPKGTSTDISLTAKWTQISYNLTYKYNLGGLADQSDSYTVDTYTSSLPDVEERADYDFAGWYMNGVKQDVVPFDWETKQTPIAFTLEAKWTVIPYAVKFDLNYEGGGKLEGDQYMYNAEQGMENLPDKTVATRTGYTLKGWYENADGTGDPVTQIAAGTGEKILYAQWTPNTYTITYYWNGGDELSSAPATFVYNVGATLPTAEEMRKDHYTFAGWTREPSSSNYVGRVEASCCAESQTFYAQWVPATYTLQFNTNGGTTVADLNYLYGSEVALKKSYRNGYAFGGWYADADLTKPVGEMVTSVTIPDNAPKTLTFYAQWNPIQYTITYDTYGGTIQSGRVDTYRTGEEVMLPTDVRRDGFSFAGWYKDDMLTTLATKIEAGDYGDKTFYATWSRGFSVIIAQPKEGVISGKQGDQSIASGTPLAKGTELTISAEPTTSGYVLKKLVINDKEYTTSPQTVTIGEENLIISAEFVASTLPVVPAPTITTEPDREKVDAEPLVKVTLAKTDEASTLYYALNEQQARLYEGLFMVDGSVGDTVTVRAIARREGYSDGIATRQVIFDGRLHLVFDLPAGVTATAPDGGTVVDAIVKGGTFEFKLQVDKDYFVSTDTMQVLANGVLITPGTNGVYRLYDQTGDVKVVVRGLQARQCTVTLLQTEHGQITFAEGAEESSRAIDYGTDLTVQAMADEDYKFSKWSTGSQKNPLTLRVVSDTTLSAQFISDYKAYQITLPEVEGVTVKPFTGYSTEVKRDGTFKFYLAIANGYHEEQLVVRADGEELEKNKGGYALYHVNKNIRISVEGIVRDTFAVTLPPQVKAWKLETMEEATEASLYAETPLLLRAVASEGQRFLKWTDGSTENPRTATALDAKQLYPLFTTLSEAPTAKVTLEQTPGAGITGAMSNLDVANVGEQLSVKVVVLPAYSQSEVRLLANGQAVEPQVRMCAASESKSYYYQVPVSQTEVKLKVEGLQLNRYQLKAAESTGGRIEGVPTGKVRHGDTVSLTAKAAEGMTFVRWWDGNTVNPYPYVVTGDQTVRAYFVGESSPVDNESITAEEVRVCSPTTGGLWIELPVPQDVWLWDSSGRLLLHRFDSGTVRLALPAGIYLLQCGMQPVIKVVVRH